MKKIIKIASILLLAVFISGCGKKENDEINNENNDTVIENKVIDGISFEDYVVVYEDNISTIYFDIINKNEETVNYNKVVCNLYENNKKLVLSFEVELGELAPGDIKSVKESFDANLTKVKNVVYKLEK